MPVGELVDINEIIKTWARDFPLERDLKRLAAEDVLNSDINWKHFKVTSQIKDVPGGFPKSDLLGVTVALIHVAAQRFLAV